MKNPNGWLNDWRVVLMTTILVVCLASVLANNIPIGRQEPVETAEAAGEPTVAPTATPAPLEPELEIVARLSRNGRSYVYRETLTGFMYYGRFTYGYADTVIPLYDPADRLPLTYERYLDLVEGGHYDPGSIDEAERPNLGDPT